ncbi:Uncharacterised protein [BD1-7 clade bacterium]|uniref:Macrodomain Ori protein n=1 Tax=BD1-7 clade bacterium TaxID=2029982 RepID=A0A5S9PBF6_9GAMM|nr:Uncharacterised protein [BD1-7 clade bacterium]CAA0101950.1 Uncharacterised protein [BD1-7 clade bacterium]
MTTTSSFASTKRFYADALFPYGFARSGEFTIQQVALLEEHGVAYDELHNGLRKPANDEERAFVAVCHGQRNAETPHETTWLHYCEKANSAVATSPLSGVLSESMRSELSSDERT